MFQGALLQLLPSKRTVLTDSIGNFQVTTKSADNIVVISSVGFITQRYPLSSRSNFNFIIEEDTKALSDVVVTAYGIKKEAKKIGYAVQELKGAELTKARDANPINSLAGKIAGLSVGANPEMLGRPELVLTWQ